MITETKTRPTQDELTKFVGREVYANCSMLICELATNEKCQDEILEFSMSYPEFGENGTITDVCEKCDTQGHHLIDQDYRVCKDCYEPDATEALEHWIVSDWLADRLEEQGEMTTKDFYGLTIWGRTCSGQAIMLDSVVEKIYVKMMSV